MSDSNSNSNGNAPQIDSRLVVQTAQRLPHKRGLLGSSISLTTSFARTMFASLAGIAFGGERDLYQTFGYNRNPQHRDFVAKYLHQDIAKRVIESPVKACWTDHPTIIGGARFEKAWKELVAQHDIFPKLSKADIMCGLGRYAILLIGIDDGRRLDQLVNTSRDNKITFLQPYMEGSIDVTEIEQSPFDPRYGLPVMYKITPGLSLTKNADALLAEAPTQGFQVHWTRVLHLADNTLESPIVGHSRLESIFNVLDDIQKVVGGAAETFWLTSNRGMQVDVDKDMELDEGDAENLSAEIEEYQHGLRRFLRTRGVKIENLGSDVADPKGVFFALMSLLASNTRIPQRVLMGAEAGQLASQQDRANWAVYVEERESDWAEPYVLKPLIRQLINMRVLPAPSKELAIEWAEAFKMSPLERGQTSAQQARSITNVARAIDTAQKGGYDLISIEEGRQITAPGKHLLELNGTPTGTFPPKLSAPAADPKNELDRIEKQGEINKAAAEAAADQPVNTPFGNPAAQPTE